MDIIVADFETFYDPANKYSLSAKKMTTQKYVLDERFKAHGVGIQINDGPRKWIPHKYIQAVCDKIDWGNAAMVGHNLPFDGSIFAWHYNVYPKMYLDTLGMARALVGPNAARHSLNALAEMFLGVPKMQGLLQSAGIRDLSADQERILSEYCVLGDNSDVALTKRLLHIFLPMMTSTELKALDWTVRNFCTPALVIDTDMLEAYQSKLAAKKQATLESVGMTDRETLNSADKFADALRALGVEPPTKVSLKTKKVAYAFAKTDAELKALLDHDNPDVQALVAARLEIKSTNEENKCGAYLESAALGCWPVSLKYAGAMNTQRFSGDSGGGGNPQNLGRGSPIRMALMAPEGATWVVGDLSQIEARVSLQLGAYRYHRSRRNDDPVMCHEQEALDMMRAGGDVYRWFGAMIYGRPVGHYLEDGSVDPERQLSKTAVLGLCFGMGWKRFMESCRQTGLEITEAFAKKIVDLYRATFPNVVKCWKDSLRQLSDVLNDQQDLAHYFQRPTPGWTGPRNVTGGHIDIIVPCRDPLFQQPAVLGPNGQHLKYPNLARRPNGEWVYWNRGKDNFIHPGKTFENIVQWLAGIGMREQLVAMEADARSEGVIDLQHTFVQLSVHDEAGALVPDTPEWIAWGIAFMTEHMTRPFSWMPELPVACEVKAAKRYGDAK